MNNSELMLAAIGNGLEDDATTSAALDAIREESGCNLLAAVLEVARVWHAAHVSKEISNAATTLRSASPLRAALMKVIVAECPGADEDRGAMVTIVGGNVWPHLLAGPLPTAVQTGPNQHIAVGARWVLDRAAAVRINRANLAAERRKQRFG